MIVAGSVLTLLLMGLAVDGFVNPADEDPDDDTGDQDDGMDTDDQSGSGTGLMDLLDANGDATGDQAAGSVAPAAFTYTPIDQIEPEDEEEEDVPASEETQADQTWEETATAEAGSDYIDIYATTEIGDGQDVPYVATFDPETDTLVLEFIGLESDTPEIDVAYDQDEDATIVSANGVPVTMVEGTEDMTTDHVRVVMGGDEIGTEPLVQPDAATFEKIDALPSETEPLVQPDIGSLGKMDEVPDGNEPQVQVPEDKTDAIDKLIAKDAEADYYGPQTQSFNLEPLLSDPSVLPDPLDEGGNLGMDDTADEAEINAFSDRVAGDPTSSGDIDNIFEAEGDDVMTGTEEADAMTGSDGDDALFGDAGDDTITAGAGDDELQGGAGDDEIHGEEGIDSLDGGQGDDSLDGGGDRDLLFGGEGDDVLMGGAAADFLRGGLGSDTLDGGEGNDVLTGVSGDGASDSDQGDALLGGDGDDHIILGQNDTAEGGAGADTFTSGSYIETAEVAGHVADFDPREDRIEVIFDPDESPDPTLEVLDFEDGSGADIILNGQVILSVSGAQGLDPNMIDLQARV